MKTLFLVRHAQAAFHGASLPDRDRPLTDRGRHDAAQLGGRLAARAMQPDLIVSSPALRALTTAQLVADTIGHERYRGHSGIRIVDRLYASSVATLLELIHGVDPALDSVMLFGHNPEFSELALRLSSRVIDMAPCAIVSFRFDIAAWSDVGTVSPVELTQERPTP